MCMSCQTCFLKPNPAVRVTIANVPSFLGANHSCVTVHTLSLIAITPLQVTPSLCMFSYHCGSSITNAILYLLQATATELYCIPIAFLLGSPYYMTITSLHAWQ